MYDMAGTKEEYETSNKESKQERVVPRATLRYLLSSCYFLEKLEDENRGQNTQEKETKNTQYFTDLRNGARGGRLKHDENVYFGKNGMKWGCLQASFHAWHRASLPQLSVW